MCVHMCAWNLQSGDRPGPLGTFQIQVGTTYHFRARQDPPKSEIDWFGAFLNYSQLSYKQ